MIVVDDGSQDATAAIARAAPGPVTVITQAARGPAAARNLGVSHAHGDRLAFCDADVYPHPGWLAAGARALTDHALVQGRVTPDPGAERGPFDRSLHIDGAVGLWETANLFVTRALFERVGGFQTWIAPRRGKALAEDVWFGHRALRAGARAAFCAEALADHAVFPRAAARLHRRAGPAALLPGHGRADARAAGGVSLAPPYSSTRAAPRFDLAVGGALAAARAGTGRRRRAAGLLAVAPYALQVRAASARAGQPRPRASHGRRRRCGRRRGRRARPALGERCATGPPVL